MPIESMIKTPAQDTSSELYVPVVKYIPKAVRWSFMLFVATLPLEAVSIPYVTSENFAITKLAGFLFFACYLLNSGLPLKLSLPPVPKAMWWFVGYFVVYAVTGLFTSDDGIRAYIMRLFKLLQLFILFWLASDLLTNIQFAKKCFLIFAAVCVFVASATALEIPGFGQSVDDRVSALDFSANHLAALMGYAALILIGYCLRESGWSAKRKFVALAATLPLLSLIVLSGSRAAMLAFALGVACFFIPHQGSRRQMLAFGMGVAAIVGLLFFILQNPLVLERWTRSIEEGEMSGRGNIYAGAWDMFTERPVFGWGGKEFAAELGLRIGKPGGIDAHNFVLYLLLEVGLVGAVPFLVGLGLCLSAAWKGRTGPFGLLPLALLVTVNVYSAAHTALTFKVFWLFLGLGVAAASALSMVRFAKVTINRKKTMPPSGLRELRLPISTSRLG